MGTGSTPETGAYRSVNDNLPKLTSRYEFNNGYFGERGNKNFIRTITCSDPQKSAADFFSTISEGGIFSTSSNGKASIATMADGTVISYRTITTTENSPAVEINIRYSSEAGGIKYQKIHFMRND